MQKKNTSHEFQPRPLLEVSDIVKTENGGDLYLAIGNKRYQLIEQISPVYNVTEYVFIGKLIKDQEISFVHLNGDKVPMHLNNNYGYTLQGNAQNLLKCEGAMISTNKEQSETYIYINKNSKLFYVGEEKEIKLFIRIFDNCNGQVNDRWMTIFAE